ncbi:hypothetical protein JTE90_014834 [Oedothorax gibbosus]|uniref:Hexosyltransferase n=1 Tax=Oedothorax gibbosus TaxID=931172 RepID=A0AAV6TTV9_9ARAC|nr:hypothetical protein JTE90_014834 [Oedothorax gibbosus]
MRRRLWCAKYALALLASAAVTFHLLYAPPDAGHDVGSQWTRDYEEESDAKTSNVLVFDRKSVFYDTETISRPEVSVETFSKIDADRGVETLRRLEVVTPRKPGAETPSKRNLNVETQMKSGIDLDIKTLNKTNVSQDVGRPKKLDVGDIIEVHRKLDSVFNVEMLRKPSILAYIESSNIAMLGGPDAGTPTLPKKYVYKQNWASNKNSNFSKNTNFSSGYTVLPGNVTIHIGNDRKPFDVTFLNAASGVCDDFDVTRTSLVVFVASSVEHFEKRQAVRDTWGLRMLQMSDNFRVVFLLGRSAGDDIQELVQQEIYRYGDIVQLNQDETFRNLGLKSVAGLKWSRDFCPKADLVMKTDDDILVHVPNLMNAVGRGGTTSKDDLLLCHENRKRKILRKELLDEADLPDSYHKYQVSEEELPGTYYPPYCSGMAYVFSASVRDRLLDACSKTPVFFIEDVHVTGFCRHKTGVRIRPHPGITLRPPVQTSCSFKGDDKRITSQELDVPGLRLLWAELNTRGFFCPQLLGLRRNTHTTSRE